MATRNATASDASARDAQGVPRWPVLPQGLARLLRHLRWHHALLAAGILLYLGIWAWSGSFTLNDTDFDVFFLPSARIALAGHPLHLYQVRYQGNYPNANGPLSLVPLTAVAWVAQHLGWLDSHEQRRALAMGVFAVFPLLLGREVLLTLDRLLGVPPRGIWRVLAFGVIIFSPELWHSVLLYGHIEQPLMLWLTLASVRALAEGRSGRSGLLMGLALLTRTTALLYLLPLVLVLALRGRAGQAWRFAGAALLTVLLGILPFLLADAKDVVYSLVTFRATLIVGGGSIWGAFQQNAAVELFAQQHDSIVILGASLVLSLLTLWARRDLDVGSRDLYVLLAVSGLCFPLFIKTLWPYYFLDIYVFVALWWLSRAPFAKSIGRRLWWSAAIAFPAATVGLAQLAEAVLSAPHYTGWTPTESLMVFTCNAAFTLVLLAVLWLWPRRLRTEPDTRGLELQLAAPQVRYT
jgi:hypothetical protein